MEGQLNVALENQQEAERVLAETVAGVAALEARLAEIAVGELAEEEVTAKE